jgi:hypothetical protein
MEASGDWEGGHAGNWDQVSDDSPMEDRGQVDLTEIEVDLGSSR